MLRRKHTPLLESLITLIELLTLAITMAIIIPIIIAGVMISIVSVIIELISYFDFLFLPHEVSGTRFIVVL